MVNGNNFQLILIAAQEYWYSRKCEVAMLMILCILVGKNLHCILGFDTSVVTSFGASFAFRK